MLSDKAAQFLNKGEQDSSNKFSKALTTFSINLRWPIGGGGGDEKCFLELPRAKARQLKNLPFNKMTIWLQRTS